MSTFALICVAWVAATLLLVKRSYDAAQKAERERAISLLQQALCSDEHGARAVRWTLNAVMSGRATLLPHGEMFGKPREPRGAPTELYDLVSVQESAEQTLLARALADECTACARALGGPSFFLVRPSGAILHTSREAE